MDDAQIASMTPEEATAALAAMQATPPVPPPDAAPATAPIPAATAADAQRKLDALSADKEWAAKLLAGHADARKELYDLAARASAADEPGLALPEEPTGIIETTINGQLPRRHVAEFIAHARELGVSDGAIAEGLAGASNTRAIYEQCKALQRAKHGDAAWVDRLLKGGYAEKREQMLMSIILSSPVAG